MTILSTSHILKKTHTLGILKSLFGKNRSKPKKQVEKSTETLKEKEEVKVPIRTVYNDILPYFKQFNPSKNNSIPLPNDLSKIDKSKTYAVPDLKIVFKNISGDLNCLYALDSETGIEIIQEKKMEELNLNKDELHEIALANFRTLLSTQLTTKGDSNGLMFMIDGNYEASIILIDEIWDQLEAQVGEPIVIFVPARDVLIATGKSNSQMIRSFSDKAKEVYLNGDHPLSKNIFIREHGKWNIFKSFID